MRTAGAHGEPQQDLDDAEGFAELVQGALRIAEGLGGLARGHVELVVFRLQLLQFHKAVVRVPGPSCRVAASVSRRSGEGPRSTPRRQCWHPWRLATGSGGARAPSPSDPRPCARAVCSSRRRLRQPGVRKGRDTLLSRAKKHAAPALKSAMALLPMAWNSASLLLLDFFFAHAAPESSTSTHSPASHREP